MAPVFKPVKKAYRDNVIFNNDFVKICDPSMPKFTDDQKKELDAFYGRYGFCMKSYYSHYRFLSVAKGVFSTEFMPDAGIIFK